MLTLSSQYCCRLQTTIKKHVLKAALKRGVETGTLVQVKNSYKLSVDAKKPAKAPKKVDNEKKAAPVKKVRHLMMTRITVISGNSFSSTF